MPPFTAGPPSPTADFRVPLVLLAGMNCTADLWSGCGLEGALMPSLDESTVDGQVEALLDTLPGRFTLAGLSLGAIVGMALCRRAPERVTGLCLMSTNAKAPTDAQRQGWQDWRDRLAAGETATDLQRDILGSLLWPRPGPGPGPGGRTCAWASTPARHGWMPSCVCRRPG